MGRGAGNVIFKSLGESVVQWKDPGDPISGLKEALVSGNSKFTFVGR